MTCISPIRINGNLNADQYVSDMLCPKVVPYLRGLPNAILQQDNARSHVANFVLTFLVTQDIRLLNCPAWSPDLSPTKIICSGVAERVVLQPL
ncbi:hypothetical protein TNCV_2023411 [Trichonephila clavipes]|nr:hypothetical protein TNCV_2023411 [Trichonephila clavipes]